MLVFRERCSRTAYATHVLTHPTATHPNVMQPIEYILQMPAQALEDDQGAALAIESCEPMCMGLHGEGSKHALTFLIGNGHMHNLRHIGQATYAA